MSFATASKYIAPALRRQLGSGARTQANIVAHRHASTSTLPRAYKRPSLSLSQAMPVEVYPLIAFVICMCSFGTYEGIRAFQKEDVQLIPARYRKADVKNVWDD